RLRCGGWLINEFATDLMFLGQGGDRLLTRQRLDTQRQPLLRAERLGRATVCYRRLDKTLLPGRVTHVCFLLENWIPKKCQFGGNRHFRKAKSRCHTANQALPEIEPRRFRKCALILGWGGHVPERSNSFGPYRPPSRRSAPSPTPAP